MQDFRKLKVWQKSHQLTLEVYRASASFPREELYGLTGQMRRSCASIPANIAEGEGCGRDGTAELTRFLRIAMGSASELDYHILLARDLALLNTEDYDHLTDDLTQIKKMLTSFVQTLKTIN